MRSACLLHLTQVVAKIASWLTREFWDATTNNNIRESGIFELFWEREVILHALVGLLKKGGQLTPESHNIVEYIKKVDNKWGNRFFTLELFLSKINPPEQPNSCVTREIMTLGLTSDEKTIAG
jgi:hypothetical protein